MMNTKILLVMLICLTTKQLFGQSKVRKMPANINHTSINNFAPYISLDGNSMVYLADVAEDNVLTVTYTTKDGVNWRDPVILPKALNTRLNFLKGYGLNSDGKTLFLTNMKSNGLGGFDLYTSQYTGLIWGEPVNMGLPINSKGHEGCPSISGDGSILFFMRCEKMDFAKAENCKIMMSNKKNGRWEEPVELPAFINTGNSQTPRIMGDGETLVFSSNKLQPNKGGMDLYVTKFINNQWSTPQPLTFVNTTADDQFVSATSLGRYLLRDSPGTKNSELVEYLFPTEVRPKGVMKIDGIVKGPENPASAFVSAFNMKDQSKVFSIKPGKDGTFTAYLKEGGLYDLSVDPESDNYTFFSKSFDLTGEKFSALEKVTANLKPAAAGDELMLEGISFKPNSSDITTASQQEMRRLVRLIQGNPARSFVLSVTLLGYERDSIRSSADLTEVHIDTTKIPVVYKIKVPVDTTKVLNKADSVITATRDSLVIKTTYHNDRTVTQAKALGNYLSGQGIPAGRVSYTSKAMPEAVIENRKTVVKVIIR